MMPATQDLTQAGWSLSGWRPLAWKLRRSAGTRRRFPRCGGFLIWMGHDCFPCPANTSLIEFDHCPKPAFAAVAKEFHAPVIPS